jgi:hypothetical protein
MAMDVCQTLLHNPEDGRFQLGRLPFEIGRYLQMDLDATPFFSQKRRRFPSKKVYAVFAPVCRP